MNRSNSLLLIGFFVASGTFIRPLAFAEDPTRHTGTRLLLLVDDHHIHYRPGTRRVVQPVKRFESNPVIADTQPWEQTIAYCSVHRDDETGRYQLWYQAYHRRQGVHLCYATSDDGLQWQRPNLGLVEFNGSKDNNIVLADPLYGASVVHDANDPDPGRRYKAAYFRKGMAVAFSPDGIRWTVHPEKAFDKFSGGRPSPPPFANEIEEYDPLGISDVIDVSFDPARQCWMAYAKTWLDGPDGNRFWRRALVRTDSEDFLQWSPPQLVSTPDEIDEINSRKRGKALGGDTAGGGTRGIHVHGGPTFYHGGVYFSLLQIIDSAHTGLMPTELAISRDGYTIERPFRDSPFIPTDGGEDFDSGAIWSNATPIFLKDEIRFYYGAYAGNWKQGLIKKPTGIGMATISPDRFAGLQAIDQVAQVTLKPVDLHDVAAIEVNAAVGDGSVRVELLDAAGFRVRGYTKDESEPMQEDSLRHIAAWNKAALADLPPGRYTLRLHLQGEATVYAITLRADRDKQTGTALSVDVDHHTAHTDSRGKWSR